MSDTNTLTKSKALVDHNAHVDLDAIVDGKFIRKGDHFMVVSFNYKGHDCSGTLHVAQFDSPERATRDEMFAAATVGSELKGLRVCEVRPAPKGSKNRLTVVRLSARSDYDAEAFKKSKIYGTYRGERVEQV